MGKITNMVLSSLYDDYASNPTKTDVGLFTLGQEEEEEGNARKAADLNIKPMTFGLDFQIQFDLEKQAEKEAKEKAIKQNEEFTRKRLQERREEQRRTDNANKGWGDFNWEGFNFGNIDWQNTSWGSFDGFKTDWTAGFYFNMPELLGSFPEFKLFEDVNWGGFDFGNIDWDATSFGSFDIFKDTFKESSTFDPIKFLLPSFKFFDDFNWDGFNFGDIDWASTQWDNQDDFEANLKVSSGFGLPDFNFPFLKGFGDIDWSGFGGFENVNWADTEWGSFDAFKDMKWSNLFDFSGLNLPEFAMELPDLAGLLSGGSKSLYDLSGKVGGDILDNLNLALGGLGNLFPGIDGLDLSSLGDAAKDLEIVAGDSNNINLHGIGDGYVLDSSKMLQKLIDKTALNGVKVDDLVLYMTNPEEALTKFGESTGLDFLSKILGDEAADGVMKSVLSGKLDQGLVDLSLDWASSEISKTMGWDADAIGGFIGDTVSTFNTYKLMYDITDSMINIGMSAMAGIMGFQLAIGASWYGKLFNKINYQTIKSKEISKHHTNIAAASYKFANNENLLRLTPLRDIGNGLLDEYEAFKTMGGTWQGYGDDDIHEGSAVSLRRNENALLVSMMNTSSSEEELSNLTSMYNNNNEFLRKNSEYKKYIGAKDQFKHSKRNPTTRDEKAHNIIVNARNWHWNQRFYADEAREIEQLGYADLDTAVTKLENLQSMEGKSYDPFSSQTGWGYIQNTLNILRRELNSRPDERAHIAI